MYKIQNALGILSSQVPTGNLVWVDQVNGIDALAVRGRMTIPFKTLVAAKNAALNGDTIVVLPGTYDETGLAKDGVNWHFLNGAFVHPTSPADHIFGVTTAMTFKVSGEGDFRTESTYSVLRVANSSSDIRFKCREINASVIAVEVTAATRVVVEAYSIFGDDGPAISISGGTVEIRAFRIYCFGYPGLYFSGVGTATVLAQELYSQTYHAVEYDASGGKLTIVDTRIFVQATSTTYKPVYITSGSPSGSPATLKLVRCVLVAYVSGGNTTIHGIAGRAIGLYGECVGNYDVSANITKQVSVLTATTNVT